MGFHVLSSPSLTKHVRFTILLTWFNSTDFDNCRMSKDQFAIKAGHVRFYNHMYIIQVITLTL